MWWRRHAAGDQRIEQCVAAQDNVVVGCVWHSEVVRWQREGRRCWHRQMAVRSSLVPVVVGEEERKLVGWPKEKKEGGKKMG